MAILGISIGTRTSGIVLIEHKQLQSWDTLSFKDSWSEKKADKIVQRYEQYLKKHHVTAVALKIPRLTHHTDAILSLLQKIDTIIKQHGCMVAIKTQADIKTALPEIKNRTDVMSHVAELYPALTPLYIRERSNKNRYHDKVFEAALVAHLYKTTNK